MKFFRNWVFPIAIGIIAGIVMKWTVVDSVKVHGQSMVPTFQSGDSVLIEKVTSYFSSPDIGDVVIVDNGDKKLIKRVVGVEGDTIIIKNGALVRNGSVINENYIKEEMIDNMDKMVTIKEDEVFVMGDNRNNSSDSRNYGPYKLDNVIGKVFLEVTISEDFLKTY